MKMLTASPKGQTMLEYTILLGVIVLILFAMVPMMKRGVQSLIRVVADQVGIQTNAEQSFDERGHMERFNAVTAMRVDKTTQQDGMGTTQYIYADRTDTQSTTLVNLGFTKD